MDLGQVTRSLQGELLEALQSDGTFLSWTRGRFAPVDRFLSNFHKPLQRRMMFTDPKVDFPSSMVVREPATGEIFLIGDSRIDAKDDESYDRLTVLHTVSNGASGLTEYFNYDTSTLDPANVVGNDVGKTSEGNFYASIEFVTAKDDREGDEAYQAKLIVFFPKNTPLKRNGVFTLNGKTYVVVQPYYDSGFSCAQVLEQTDDMQAIIYKAVNEALSGYNSTTGSLTLSTVDHTYPGTVDKFKTVESGRTVYNVYIKYDTPLAPFRVGSDLQFQDGTLVKIVTVAKDNNTQGQWHLVCEGG